MKVALIGASGQAGSRILAELSARGHQVTAIARSPEKIAVLRGVTAARGDVYDKGGEFLELLRNEAGDLDWTFLSPAAMFVPGERTGKFRRGKDQLLANDKGSSISFEDYAIAAVDELEKPEHIRERFTVGY
jgi:putative NADH-flavin reductase